MTTPIEMLFDGVKWTEAPKGERVEGVPYITHEGVVELPGMLPMRCYRISDGRAVFDGHDLEAWLLNMDPDPPEEIRKLLDENRIAIQR